MKLGLSENQAVVVLYLFMHGISTVAQISRHTGLSQQQIGQELQQLSSSEIIVAMKDPEQYYALPIQEVIDLLMGRRKGQV